MQTHSYQDKSDNQPLLSIWCLSYNHRDFISEAIESFLAQKTEFKFEIIIHDDASTDGTQEIIKDYQNQYPDIIKVIYQEKNQYSQGINPINAIYAMTKSKFIAFCEGDDYWDDPQKLQTQVNFLINNPDYVATFHKSSTIDKEGNLIEEMPPHQCQNISAKDLQFIKRGMPSRTICMRNVINFDDAILCKYNRPDKILNGDTFMCSLLGSYGDAKFIDSIKPAVYRCWGGGIWSNLNTLSKKLTQVKSFYYISQYYLEIGNKPLCDHFATASANLLFSLPHFQCNSKLLAIKILFPRTYKLAKKCKKFITKRRSETQKSTSLY